MGAVNMRLHRQVVEAVAGAHRYRCALQLELPFAVDAPEELHEILRSLRNQLDIIARHQEVPEGARVDRQRNVPPDGFPSDPDDVSVPACLLPQKFYF